MQQEDRDEDVVKFIGKGLQTKEYINLEKYKDELQVDVLEVNLIMYMSGMYMYIGLD